MWAKQIGISSSFNAVSSHGRKCEVQKADVRRGGGRPALRPPASVGDRKTRNLEAVELAGGQRLQYRQGSLLSDVSARNGGGGGRVDAAST
jgi:hypothetical protein